MTASRRRLARLGTAATATLVGLVAVGRLPGHAGARPQLPYYNGPDFTPVWTETPHRVGHFSLTTQTGAALTDADLAGHVSVVNFMFTRCAGLCPTVMARLRTVQAALGRAGVELVSFTVTPEIDPPDLLAAFGQAHGVDPAVWRLVTGDRPQVYRLARESYFADDPRRPDTGAILHTEKVLLVDRDARLRGVYNGTLAFDMERLIADGQQLSR
jgi:protein SCO1/2